jgi:hypothetical protein
MDFPVQREQQRNSVFGDGIRGIDRDARNGSLQPPGGVDIHIVELRTPKSHQLDTSPALSEKTGPADH